MPAFFRFKPDLSNWRREARGVYVANDGLSQVVHRNARWIAFVRDSLDQRWRESLAYAALHAAQDDCRRYHAYRTCNP